VCRHERVCIFVVCKHECFFFFYLFFLFVFFFVFFFFVFCSINRPPIHTHIRKDKSLSHWEGEVEVGAFQGPTILPHYYFMFLSNFCVFSFFFFCCFFCSHCFIYLLVLFVYFFFLFFCLPVLFLRLFMLFACFIVCVAHLLCMFPCLIICSFFFFFNSINYTCTIYICIYRKCSVVFMPL
jgi:hypothetical protein